MCCFSARAAREGEKYFRSSKKARTTSKVKGREILISSTAVASGSEICEKEKIARCGSKIGNNVISFLEASSSHERLLEDFAAFEE